MRIRLALVLVVPLLLVLVACSGSDDGDGASSPTTSIRAPATTVRPGPPATRGPTTIMFGPVTFYAPSGWDKAEAGSTTAYVGVLAGGKGDVNLRVMLDYAGTVEALQPAQCLGAPPADPASVELIESGFAPVGNLTAEYRRWRFTCPGGDLAVEEHGVWLLPVSRIAIVEQRHAPEVLDVVTTAQVA